MEKHLADINVRRLLLIGAMSLILLVEIVLLTQAGYHYAVDLRRQAEIENATWDVKKLERRQKERINELRWVDREKGLVAIPIDAAMERVAERRDGEPAVGR